MQITLKRTTTDAELAIEMSQAIHEGKDRGMSLASVAPTPDGRLALEFESAHPIVVRASPYREHRDPYARPDPYHRADPYRREDPYERDRNRFPKPYPG